MHPVTLPSPPDWSLLVGTVGRASVWIATALFVLSAAAWLFGKRREPFAKVGAWAFSLGSVALFGALVTLGILFVAERYEYNYVFGHCDSQTELQYRIAGLWAGQEGSFLLWACCAALFGLITVHRTEHYRRWYTVVYALFLGAIAAILCFESPFILREAMGKPYVPADGQGMMPVLLNYWMVVHPPVIFLGFAALTVLFAYSFAALATGDRSRWAVLVRPWGIVAMTLTGLGLCMGGFWAYETLGWGGFWMWDPVENASFVPWMFAAAFVHGIPVQIVKGKWVASNLLLAGLPFLAFVYGTFLTRSGVLSESSVHSFSDMDSSALKILTALLGAGILVFAVIWAWRAISSRSQRAAEPAEPAGIHREGTLRLGSWLLMLMGVLTLIGMSTPAIQFVTGAPIKSVEEGLYHRVLVWIFVPLMCVLAVGPFAVWRSMGFRAFLARIYNVFCVAFGLVGLTMLVLTATPFGKGLNLTGDVAVLWAKVPKLPWMLFLIGLCYFVAVSAIWLIVEQARRLKLGTMAMVSHLGLALLMAGLIVSRGFERKAQVFVQEGSPGSIPELGMQIAYKGQTATSKDRSNQVLLDVTQGKSTFRATPGMYYQMQGDGREAPVLRPFIQRHPLHDVYIALQPEVRQPTEPLTLMPGKSVDFQGYKLTYVKLLEPGEGGLPETEIGVRLKVTTHMRSYEITPTAGMRNKPGALGKRFLVYFDDIDASSNAAVLRIEYASAIFPVEVFYKPLTILVWGGTGILTLAGLLAAWARRAAPRAGLQPET